MLLRDRSGKRTFEYVVAAVNQWDINMKKEDPLELVLKPLSPVDTTKSRLQTRFAARNSTTSIHYNLI